MVWFRGNSKLEQSPLPAHEGFGFKTSSYVFEMASWPLRIILLVQALEEFNSVRYHSKHSFANTCKIKLKENIRF